MQDQQKGYFQKLMEFGEAMKARGYENVLGEDAKDFVDIITDLVGHIMGIATAVDKRDTAAVTARTQGLKDQEYRETVGPYEEACFSALKHAAVSIDDMNRFFKLAGMETFADIDTKDNAAVQKVAGDIMVEVLEGKAGPALENTFQCAVQKETDNPGAATKRPCDMLAQKGLDIPRASPARFRLVRERPWLQVYSDDKIEIKLRDMGENWDIKDLLIDVKSLEPCGPSYHVVSTGAGFLITAEPGLPTMFMRPNSIRKVIDQLEGSIQTISNLEDFLRSKYPDVPIAGDT